MVVHVVHYFIAEIITTKTFTVIDTGYPACCFVLHIWHIQTIPTYRVYRLYDKHR